MKTLKTSVAKLGLHLSSEQLEQFEIYYRELIDWNTRINLTAITDYEEVQVKHFLDSLTVITAVPELTTGEIHQVLDIGAGAGLPGIPLKIVFPDIRLTLLEATAKKVAFLKHIIQRLDIRDAEAVKGRAEELAYDAGHREKYQLVLSRAVAALPALAELALPFAAVGGIFVAFKKGDISGEIENSSRAIEISGGKMRESKPIELDELADERSLVIIDKIHMTPPEFPRRPGIPVKRPIR